MSFVTRVFPFAAALRCCLLLLVSAAPLVAQNLIETDHEADSLRRLIATAKHDTTRINAMNELALYLSRWKALDDSAMVLAREAKQRSERFGYRTGSAGALNVIAYVEYANRRYPQAREQFRTALRIHEEQGNRSGMATSLFFIGTTFWNEENYQEAVPYFFKALRIYEELGNKRGIYTSFDGIGNMYQRLGKYNLALEYFLKALRVSEELGDKVKTAVVLRKIGEVASNQGKYAEALVYHQKALLIREELGEKSEIARSLMNIGSDYGYMGQYPKALEYLFKALEMYGEKGSRAMRSVCLNSIGYFYNRNEQYKEAQPYLLQALRLQNEVMGKQNVYSGMNTLNNLAISYRGQGKYDSALTFARKALVIADSTGVKKSVQEALEELAIIVDSLGRPREALAYYKRFMAVKDSLVNLESLKKTAELKEGYEAEKREQQITLLNKERALQESELSRRTVVQWSLSGILAAVVAGAVWFGALYRQKYKANKAIMRQQALLEDQAHEIQQANEELHTQNEVLAALNMEKNEIIGIVAHDLKNPIAAVRGYAELIENQTFTGNKVLSASGHIVQVTERMLELVKNLLDINHLESGSFQLNIVSFDIAPLVEASIYQYRAPAEAKNITLHFSNEFSNEAGSGSIVSADQQALMQVVDNLISNAVKYSPQEKNVFVRLKSSSEAVRMEVQDEGPGLSPDDMKKLFGKFARLSAQPTGGEHSTGLGLSIVKKMVEAMNGYVWCESEVGKGATFIVELPKASEQ